MECAATMPREWHYRASRVKVSGFILRKIRFPAANQGRDSLISRVPSKPLQVPEVKVSRLNAKLDESLTFFLYPIIVSQGVRRAAYLSLSFSSTEVIPT
jgi:hypothetical protein